MFRHCMVGEEFQPDFRVRSHKNNRGRKQQVLEDWVKSQCWSEKDSVSILNALKQEGIEEASNLLELTESDLKDIAEEGNLNILTRRKLIAAVFGFQDENDEENDSDESVEGMTTNNRRDGYTIKTQSDNNVNESNTSQNPMEKTYTNNSNNRMVVSQSQKRNVKDGKTEVRSNSNEYENCKKKQQNNNDMRDISSPDVSGINQLHCRHWGQSNNSKHSCPSSTNEFALHSINKHTTIVNNSYNKKTNNEHNKRRKVVIVKVEPNETKIYDELVQKREFFEDTIQQLEQKQSQQTNLDDVSCQNHVEKITKYYDEIIEHLSKRKAKDLEKLEHMYTCKKNFETKVMEQMVVLSEQCQQVIDQYNKALESPEGINDAMRRQVLYDFYENTQLKSIQIPISNNNLLNPKKITQESANATSAQTVVDQNVPGKDSMLELVIDKDIVNVEFQLQVDYEQNCQKFVKSATFVQIKGETKPKQHFNVVNPEHVDPQQNEKKLEDKNDNEMERNKINNKNENTTNKSNSTTKLEMKEDKADGERIAQDERFEEDPLQDYVVFHRHSTYGGHGKQTNIQGENTQQQIIETTKQEKEEIESVGESVTNSEAKVIVDHSGPVDCFSEQEKSSFLQMSNNRRTVKSGQTEDWTYHQVFGEIVVDDSVGRYYWRIRTGESFYGRLAIVDYGNLNLNDYSFEDTLFEHPHSSGCGSVSGWYVGTHFGDECSALSKFFNPKEDVQIYVDIPNGKAYFENMVTSSKIEVPLPIFTRKIKLVVECIVRSCDCEATIVDSGRWNIESDISLAEQK